MQVDCQNLLSTGLLQVVLTKHNKSTNDNSTKLTRLLQLVDKLQQASKIDNLQQVCGILGCPRDDDGNMSDNDTSNDDIGKSDVEDDDDDTIISNDDIGENDVEDNNDDTIISDDDIGENNVEDNNDDTIISDDDIGENDVKDDDDNIIISNLIQ